MCGIAGIFRPDGADIDAARVLRMRDTMVFRGPDDAGLKSGRGFALGHRRLAIIDLTPAGHQPMCNEDGSVHIVFNGEIYDFMGLRDQLTTLGHVFQSRSDTEVLLHGYEQWGLEGLLKRVRGMFAFAIVDSARGEVHLGRDHLGKKPLFYHWAGGELVFASSAAALVQGLKSTPEVNPHAIDALLWNLYIPGPETIFRGVSKLEPGSALTIDRHGRVRTTEYWSPDFLHPDQQCTDEHQLVDEIEAVLSASIRRRLVADVPLGVLVSGGVDSSLVAALAARSGSKIKTFSVAADDPGIDETRFAQAVAEHCGTEHHVLPVKGDARQTLAALMASMGEPLADASAINLQAISRVAREQVTVVLTGDGGDEGFGGYSYFWAYYQAGRLSRAVPPGARPVLAAAGRMLGNSGGLARRAGTLLHLAGAPVQSTLGNKGWISAGLRGALYTSEVQSLIQPRVPAAHYRTALPAGANGGATQVDQVMQAHLRTTLVDDYLAKVDSATMSASLEARCPLLDLDLLEKAMRIPAGTRFNREPKALLKQLARRHLPVEIINRRKQGFLAPVGKWLRTDWTDLVDELVLGPHVEQRGWFRRDTLRQIAQEHRLGADHGYLLWSLLVLELWMRVNVDRTIPAASSI